MKKLFLFTVLSLITIGAMAQDKANHNTSRSNKTTGGKIEADSTTRAIPAFKKYVGGKANPNTDVNESETDSITNSNTTGSGNTANGYQALSLVKGGGNGNTDANLSKADAERANPSAEVNESDVNVLERKKCIKTGGTFYEFPNGTTKCLPAGVSAKSQNLPSEKMDDKDGVEPKFSPCYRSCINRIRVTNSTGTAYYDKLPEGKEKLKFKKN